MGDETASLMPGPRRPMHSCQPPLFLGRENSRAPTSQLRENDGGAANLARREIAVMFDALFRRLRDIEVSAPALLLSAFIHGVRRLPCRFTPTQLAQDPHLFCTPAGRN
jgi:hypothetical protein